MPIPYIEKFQSVKITALKLRFFHVGSFQYKRIPFGIKNARATFQRSLNLILSWYKWKTCLFYLYYVIIYSSTVEAHILQVAYVLTALGKAGVSLKIWKCKIFKNTVEYLGHIIRPGTLEVDLSNTESPKESQISINRGEFRYFLGLCNVYRRFIDFYSDKAAPLIELLRKGKHDSCGDLDEAHTSEF